MSAPNPAPLVAVKLTPVGRAQTFLLGDLPAESAPRAGDTVVVQTDGGPAVGTVVRGIPQLDAKRRPPADSPHRVVRLATREDVVARLKHKHREDDAYRIALLKIRERGLGMKLARVEQAFDNSKLVFYFTADSRVDFRELVRELAAEQRTVRGRTEGPLGLCTAHLRSDPEGRLLCPRGERQAILPLRFANH